jgi:hypothetical protein
LHSVKPLSKGRIAFAGKAHFQSIQLSKIEVHDSQALQAKKSAQVQKPPNKLYLSYTDQDIRQALSGKRKAFSAQNM